MPSVADRARETAAAPGTGNVTLAGAASGFRTLSSAVPVGCRFAYAIESSTPGNWETGVGYLSNSTTLVRESVEFSSNSNALVNFTGGVNVFITATADLINRSSRGRLLASARGFDLQ